MTDILQEASELINGDRAQTYGPVTDNFQRIADLFAAYLGDTDTDELDPYDVANLMILVKVARIKNAGYHRDSYADIAGYAALAEKVYNEAYPLVPRPDVTSNVTDWDEFWNDIDRGIAEAGRTWSPAREWKSLADVPRGFQVVDATGDVWTHKLGVWGFTVPGGEEWYDTQEPSMWDDYSPFTEVLS